MSNFMEDDFNELFGDLWDDEASFKMCAAEEILKYKHISDDFLRHLVDADPGWVFLSDESRLGDFMMDVDELEREIFLRYGIDVEDIPHRNLLAIFKRIDEEGIVPRGKK